MDGGSGRHPRSCRRTIQYVSRVEVQVWMDGWMAANGFSPWWRFLLCMEVKEMGKKRKRYWRASLQAHAGTTRNAAMFRRHD
eukprot:scaffold26213_cov132-Cylindrotheca_fusiformis.AAC.1